MRTGVWKPTRTESRRACVARQCAQNGLRYITTGTERTAGFAALATGGATGGGGTGVGAAVDAEGAPPPSVTLADAGIACDASGSMRDATLGSSWYASNFASGTFHRPEDVGSLGSAGLATSSASGSGSSTAATGSSTQPGFSAGRGQASGITKTIPAVSAQRMRTERCSSSSAAPERPGGTCGQPKAPTPAMIAEESTITQRGQKEPRTKYW